MPISSEMLEYLEDLADEKLCLSCWLECLEEYLHPSLGTGVVKVNRAVVPKSKYLIRQANLNSIMSCLKCLANKNLCLGNPKYYLVLEHRSCIPLTMTHGLVSKERISTVEANIEGLSMR